MKGYKVFRADWCATHGSGVYQFRVGGTYKVDGKSQIRKNGFHFCKNLADCFHYYELNAGTRIAEIEAIGDIDETYDACCTNEIRIVKEISWADVLQYL